MDAFGKWIAVVLATVNPLTGRAGAILLGIGGGLPWLPVCIVAAISNFLLAAAIILAIDRVDHIPVIQRFIERKRGRKMTRFIEGKGVFYAVFLGPLLLGTFTVVLIFQALGTDKRRMITYSLVSAIALTPLIAWVSLEAKDFVEALLGNLASLP
ncbi:MAG: hypothetical protein M0T84_09250 [Betaproteobacteria bacterium]|nr:hypothetical protein [Betaproteobacteria bacterium]